MTWTLPNILTVLRLFAAPGVALMFLWFPRPLADWLALALFVGASLTDWVDGYLARAWKQETLFGAMMDPIADKAMVVIAIMVIAANAGMNPWLILPATVILFREVFVSGLREFLAADAGHLQVTKLAKWKTTAQMVAIAVLFLGTGFEQVHLSHYAALHPADYQAAMDAGPTDQNGVWMSAEIAWYGGLTGIALLWVAGALTAITGWDYYSKARPYLQGGKG